MMNFSLLLNIQPQLVFLLSLTLVKSYRFTLPSKDTTWYLERPCEIRWQTEGSDLRLVELYLVQSQGQGHKQSLSSSLTGMEGIYNYPSLKGIQIGEGYKVQMVSVNTKSVLSESPMFSIRATPGSSGSNEMNSTFGRQIGGPMMGNITGYRSGGGGSVSSSYAGLGGYRNSSSYGGGYQNGTFGGSGHSGTMNNTIGMGEGTSGGIKPNTIHGSSQVLGGGINQGYYF
ncbi:hypothetical protein BY996DRAFT_7790363 [Phakopsora pachyrhizi]|nr:hypothetical protein BY996DRAFT_7790363 [Phakopsora pachyrhizi]